MRLPSADRAVSNVWINDDIRPLEPERRTWNTMTFISFWLVNQVASKPTTSNFYGYTRDLTPT